MTVITTQNNKTYSEYKDSGVEWLGEIPQNWEVKKFKFILNLSKGLTITKQNLINEGVFCVNYGEIHSKYGFELDTTKHKLKCVSEEYLTTDPNSLLNIGDFIFADTSEDIEGSGNFTHLRSNDKTFAGYHTVIARPKIEILSLFLAFVFDSTSFRNQIRKKVKGVKVYSITQSVLKETNVWIPPLTEQTAIANFLDEKTANIDKAIAQKEKLITLLKERKQILIQNAVTKGLNPNVNLKPSGVEWIGDIPEHWEVKRLKHVTSKIGSGVTPSGGGTTYLEKGIPLLRSQNIFFTKIELDGVAYISKKTHDSMNNSKVEDRDVLLNITGGSIGRCYYVNSEIEMNVNQHVCIVRPNNLMSTIFLNGLLASKIGQGQIWYNQQGGGREGLNFQALKNFVFPLPDISEQLEISKYLKNKSLQFENSITLNQKQIEKLKEYKATLINSAVTGKIKVC